MDRITADLERTLIFAGYHRQLVVLYDDACGGRIVEPYRIYNGRHGQRLLHCYQVAGCSQSGQRRGWKNVDLSRVVRVMPLDVAFDPRGEYRQAAEEAAQADPTRRLRLTH